MTEAFLRGEVPESDVAAPFWQATREQRLVLQWCDACARPVHYPREACPRCLGDRLTWRAASGNGTVYSATLVHRAPSAELRARVPYVVALVDLDEGARLVTNVVGADALTVAVGDRVTVDWEPLADGRFLPVFRRS